MLNKTIGPFKATLVTNPKGKEIKAIVVEMDEIHAVLMGPIEFDFGSSCESDAIEFIHQQPDVDYSGCTAENSISVSGNRIAVILGDEIKEN